MRTLKLVLEYDGTRYAGWQRQPHARTVQGELLKAAETLLASKVELGGSGRTDAGVHALHQVAHLKLKPDVKVPATRELTPSLNKLLPHDINILRVENVRADFHARHDAVSRYYLYQISARRTAFCKPFVWWVRDRLDVGAMKEACALLVGRHDFRSFCETSETQTSTLVQVETAEIALSGSLILFRIGASHFLWKMVRRIVGALVELGRGNLRPGAIENLLVNYSKEPAAWTAPPSGLFLERVLYPGDSPPGALVPAFPVQ